MKNFKPMLAPNQEVDLNNIKYPILASYKLDGIRCLFIKGEMLSRSLKPIQNKQLREKMQPLTDYSREHDLILDGEIYSPELTFQEITRYVMTQDFEDIKSIKKHGEVLKIPEHLKFYAFDYIDDNLEEEFFKRCLKLHKITEEFKGIAEYVIQADVYKKEDVEVYFENALKRGYEGLILKASNSRYKCGRGTIKEGLIYKVKPFVTFEAKIKEVIQSTEVIDKEGDMLERLIKENIISRNVKITYGEVRDLYEKHFGKLTKTNELGRSVTSKKKGDRILIEKASAFIVEYEGQEVKPVLAMTDTEKEEVWANRESYIGKMIEYKGMMVGAKDVPRHPVVLRFRKDKDE